MASQLDPARRTRIVRLMFAGMALASLAAGLALYILAERLGLDDDTARTLATAFFATAVADALILYFWDRIFTQKR